MTHETILAFMEGVLAGREEVWEPGTRSAILWKW